VDMFDKVGGTALTKKMSLLVGEDMSRPVNPSVS